MFCNIIFYPLSGKTSNQFNFWEFVLSNFCKVFFYYQKYTFFESQLNCISVCLTKQGAKRFALAHTQKLFALLKKNLYCPSRSIDFKGFFK